MVVIADQVQDPMNDYTVQLVLEIGSIESRILPDRIDADEQVAGKGVALTIIESDDVGIVIVLKIFKIDVQNILVRTKNDGNVTKFPHLTLGNKFEPLGSKTLLLEKETDVFSKIRNHRDCDILVEK